ncbi:MAG: ABC transporter ATP-binding protein [Patescibacteria group bacterium]|nr:ABC transporter ATP-binding protein [Patescibacteria group bacterium]
MKGFLLFTWKLLRPHRGILWLCGGLAVVAAALDTAGPLLMGRVLDAAGQRTALPGLFMLVVAWAVLRLVAETTRNYLALRGDFLASEASIAVFRDFAARILNKPMAFHHGTKISQMNERLGRLRWEMFNLIYAGPFDLAPAVLAMLAILVYVATLDWRIAVGISSALAVYIWLTAERTAKYTELRRVWDEKDSKATGIAWDALRNILVVKSTTNERLMTERLASGMAESHEAYAKSSWHDFLTNIGQTAAVTGAGLLTLAFGAAGVAAGRLTVGQLAALMAYALSIFGYVRYMNWQFRSALRSYAGWRELNDGLLDPPEDFLSGEAVAFKGQVEFCDVHFSYNERRAVLKDVCFKVLPGTSVAVVGESGEGKTTLMDLLGRYYEPDAGSILLDGRDIRTINLRSLREQMAYVPQDLTLFHESLDFNIRYGRMDATDEEVHEAARLAGLGPFIESLPEKYATVVGERGLKLSGGERQRVALARAFLRDPRLLILDEPTSNLDSKTEEIIRASLRQLMAGRTTFIIAHRLKTASEADMILVLKDGRIVEAGRHEELAARTDGAYRALLDAQGLR